ncbi:hypothetical protein B0H13DRAFT_2174629, partial [Mycena leptocephala]
MARDKSCDHDPLCLAAMEPQSRQRPPQGHQQPQGRQEDEQQESEGKRGLRRRVRHSMRRLRNSIGALLPKRRRSLHSTATTPPTNEKRRASRSPSPSPPADVQLATATTAPTSEKRHSSSPSPTSLPADVQGEEEETSDSDAEDQLLTDTHLDVENVDAGAPLDTQRADTATTAATNEERHSFRSPSPSPLLPPPADVQGAEEETPDSDAAEEDLPTDADSGVENVGARAPPDDVNEHTPTPMPETPVPHPALPVLQPQAQVPHPQAPAPEVGHRHGDQTSPPPDTLVVVQGGVHTTAVPRPPIPPVGASDMGGPPPAYVPAASSSNIGVLDPLLITAAAEAMTAAFLAGFVRAVVASAPPGSISPLSPSPSSPPNNPVNQPPNPPPSDPELNAQPPPPPPPVRQTAPAPARQAPPPMQQPTPPSSPPRTAPSAGSGSQAGRSRDRDICYKCEQFSWSLGRIAPTRGHEIFAT